ncbi:MAG: glycosyltransferase [Cytophagales bacterium]|nr:MAG: glycosyltransferase [Cytophagales bacterium]
MISILLAVRNEEKNILRCLDALAKLDFPINEMEILIGNDQSDDRSKELILNFIKDKLCFQLIDIQENIGTAKGKGNVIAHLAHHAKGDYFLITDADVAVPTTWAKGMKAGFEKDKKIGIVTGFTIVSTSHKKIIDILDCIDWVNNIGLMNIASMLKIPTNSMGNNMAVSKAAYFETGGLEAQPFMITEDLAMFKAIVKNKWQFAHLHSPDIVGVTHPQETFYDLLQQRKRWLNGALKIPIYLTIPLLINGLFLFFLIPLLMLNWQIGLFAWVLRFAFHAANLTYFALKIGKAGILKYLPLYELFITFFNPLVFIFYLLPIRMAWKKRFY